MIETFGLTKKFGNIVAVDNASVKIAENEIFGFIGPNGAGKTTMIRMLCCILKPSKGTASVMGYDIEKQPNEVRQVIGYLPENPSLYEKLTPYQILKYFGELYGVKKEDLDIRIKEILSIMELYDRRNDKIGDLSKGMKQRLSIARAMVHDPPILILDEPTTGLDPASAISIRELIKKQKERGKTIILCTHYMDEAEKLCDRIGIFNNGKLVAVGSPNKLIEKIKIKVDLGLKLDRYPDNLLKEIRESGYASSLSINDGILHLSIRDESYLTDLTSLINRNSCRILDIWINKPGLEDVFVEVTKNRD
ncbi:MAG: ABC transporter ATP-binding protein [Candidatus Hydrothermarchaeota archaeon]